MGRTKQTSRKISGGMAPRKCLVNQATSSVQTGNQTKSHNIIEYDVSYSSSFFAHNFYTGTSTKEQFDQGHSTLTCTNPLSEEKETWMSVYFKSFCDGEQIKSQRPKLNL